MGIYLATIKIALIILAITATDALSNRMINKRRRLLVATTCLCIALAGIGEAIGVVTNGGSSDFIVAHKMAKLLEFSVVPALGVCAAMAYGNPVKPKIAIVAVCVHGAFQLVALQFNLVFSVDSNNIYDRQEFYWVYVLAFVFSMIYAFTSILKRERQYQVGGYRLVLVMNIIFLIIGVGIEFVFSPIKIDYLSLAIANLFLSIGFFRTELMVDSTTGLLNRRCYEAKLEKLGNKAVIMYFDIDGFKEINDMYGHDVGDKYLKKTAQILKNTYSRYGTCYRVGGDEFCVIMPGGDEKLTQLAETLKNEIDEVKAQDKIMPEISSGYAVYDAGKSHIQRIIEEADAMLYISKGIRQELGEERKYID